MRPFDYARATDLAGAVRGGAMADTRFLAGGTTLVDLMKLEVETPSHVLDINPLRTHEPAMSGVTELPDGGLRLGALAHMSDVAWDERLRERYPLVSQSLLLAASGQVHVVCISPCSFGNRLVPTSAKTSSICSGISPLRSRAAYSACDAMASMTRFQSSSVSCRNWM